MATERLITKAPVTLGTTPTRLYTAPTTAGENAVIRSILLTSIHDFDAALVTIGIRSGDATAADGSASTDTAADRIVYRDRVESTDRVNPLPDGVAPGLAAHATTPDHLYAVCDKASAVNVTVTLVEVVP